jgi:hypothetical protein
MTSSAALKTPSTLSAASIRVSTLPSSSPIRNSISTTTTKSANDSNRQQQQQHQQQQDSEKTHKRRRFHHALFPILGAPIFVLGFYTVIRFWPVDDEEAMLNRHSFIAADGNVDLPSTPPQLRFHDDSFTL